MTPSSVANPDIPSDEAAALEVGAGRLIASVLLGAVAADWLLYEAHRPGAALSLFAMVLAALILWNRRGWREDRGLRLASPLILLAIVQAAVAFSGINVLVLFVMLTVLAGMRFDLPWSQRWPGWLEALAAWPKALGRWRWAAESLRGRREEVGGSGIPATLLRGVQMLLPGVLLLLLFGVLLGAGNALAGSYFGQAWDAVAEAVRGWAEFSPPRIAFWAVMATGVLGLCFPGRCSAFVRACTADWRRVSLSAEPRVVLWQTWISLAVLNGLFLFVNTLDVFYLWMRAELPPGVNYSSFVHEGVYALIASTVLAGLVLSFFFQQPAGVSRSRIARVLAVAWIVQNLLLMTGVALRLHIYIDAFGWSVLRFHVGSFLLLTAAGFCLLSAYIIKGFTLRWLVLSNLAAVFGLFYLLQFANVPGWVAQWNVDRWLAGEGPALDVDYLESLGPPAWPALVRAAEEGVGWEAFAATEAVDRVRTAVNRASASRTWRSWQWRRQQWEKTVIADEPGVPEISAHDRR